VVMTKVRIMELRGIFHPGLTWVRGKAQVSTHQTESAADVYVCNTRER
jgi:hypothetical protein